MFTGTTPLTCADKGGEVRLRGPMGGCRPHLACRESPSSRDCSEWLGPVTTGQLGAARPRHGVESESQRPQDDGSNVHQDCAERHQAESRLVRWIFSINLFGTGNENAHQHIYTHCTQKHSLYYNVLLSSSRRGRTGSHCIKVEFKRATPDIVRTVTAPHRSTFYENAVHRSTKC